MRLAEAEHDDDSEGIGSASPILDLTFAGTKWRLVHHCREIQICTDPRTAEFLSRATRKPDVTLHVRWAREFAPMQEVLFDAGLWRAYAGEPHVFDFQSEKFGPMPYKRATFNREYTEGEVLLSWQLIGKEQSYYPFEYPLDELATMHRLGLGQGVELHSCGMVNAAGEATLFVGHSGAGKSTMGRMWVAERQARILSDDRNIITRGKKGFRLHGTPWHGEAGLASNSSARLASICLIEHGANNELIPLAPAVAAAELFARSFVPWYRREALDFTLGFLQSVVDTVPVHVLRFVPDAHVLEFLETSFAN
jgi:hypothetical protein